MADTVSELLPCPFCGGDARRFTIGSEEPANAGGDVITCTRCQASSHVEFGRKENLVTRWNTRASTQPAPAFPREEVERVAETALYNSAMNGSSAEVCVTAREITDAIAALLQGKQP